MKYLTPSQYLRSDDGLLSAPNLTLATVRRFILRAEAMIDGYCGFDQRYGGFEPHTMWIQSAWDNSTLKTYVPIWPVPVRRALRYRIQVSMLGSGGGNNNPNNPGFFANIQPGDVAYNTTGNYVEIVPLQAVLYSMLPVMVELGMNPPIVQLDAEMGYYFDAINEQLDDDGSHLTYYTGRGNWAITYDQQATIQSQTLPIVGMQVPGPSIAGDAYTQNPGGLPYILYKNGTPVTTGFTADPVEGKFVFTTPNSASDLITASYSYQIPDAVHEATICQTTYLLAQRDLTRQGMRALDTVQNAQQTMQRHTRSQIAPGLIDEPSMDPAAMQLLSSYVQWPFG